MLDAKTSTAIHAVAKLHYDRVSELNKIEILRRLLRQQNVQTTDMDNGTILTVDATGAISAYGWTDVSKLGSIKPGSPKTP